MLWEKSWRQAGESEESIQRVIIPVSVSPDFLILLFCFSPIHYDTVNCNLNQNHIVRPTSISWLDRVLILSQNHNRIRFQCRLSLTTTPAGKNGKFEQSSKTVSFRYFKLLWISDDLKSKVRQTHTHKIRTVISVYLQFCVFLNTSNYIFWIIR